MRTEAEFRKAITDEALTWVGTPYKQCACIKGVGVNCAMFLWGVAQGAGILPADAQPPRWYTPQLATHSREERLIDYVKSYGAIEVEIPQPGDIVLYKTGKSHGHAAIVLDWPTKIIHALPPNGVQMGHADEGRLGRFQRRYFTLWAANSSSDGLGREVKAFTGAATGTVEAS
jgi:cell wall-associated NlpC family hydrolase